MAATLCPLSLTPILDPQGRPYSGAHVEIFDAGTLTPRAAYQNSGLGALHTRPIVASSGGRIPTIWIDGETSYRVRLVTASGSLIEDIDGITADVSGGGGGGGGGGTSPFVTGDVIWSYRTGIRTGMVRCNGRTVGSASSGAVERANADCEDLFVHLWTNDTTLVVSGGRGSTASADWSANKTIALPDLRSRTPFGIDTMGASAAGRLTGATFGTGDAISLGASGGAGAETLLTAQIPGHSHTGNTATNGAHTHTGSTASVADHSHTGSTNVQGEHAHAMSVRRYAAIEGGTTFFYSEVASGGYEFDAFVRSAGAHSHNFATDGAGAHNHNFTTASDGSHFHEFSTNPAGGGSAHNNMPPFVLGTFYILL